MEKLAHKVHPEWLDHLGSQDRMDNLDHLDLMERMEHPDHASIVLQQDLPLVI
ncbi:unnamed protein product, partial [Cylicostephanus goldi]